MNNGRTDVDAFHPLILAVVQTSSGAVDKGKQRQSSSRTLLEALATAIDGTDTVETMRLAAEFNNSFGSLVRASVGPESEAGQDDLTLLGSFGPAGQNMQSTAKIKEHTLVERLARDEPAGAPDPSKQDDVPKSQKSLRDTSREESSSVKPKKTKKEESSSSDDSETPKPKKKKAKRKSSKKKKSSDSSSPSSTSSESDSSLSDSDTSQDSEDEEKAELVYEITDFESADLPDLPDKWDKGFKKLRSYVPLTLFKTSLLENYYDDEAEPKQKDKSEMSKSALKIQEKQLTYGDFIEMCDLEERYAREIYGLDTYADYVTQHKRIVSDLKKTYNCWMIGLRYHLKVRTVIFRRRKLVKSKVKGKTVLKDKVKIPNGLQPAVERQARHDADRAGDLQFVDNPYAIGGPKFGYNFATGRPVVSKAPMVIADKASESSSLTGGRGKRAGSFKRPYPRKSPYSSGRYQRSGTEPTYGGETQHVGQAAGPTAPKPYFHFKNPRPAQAAEGQKSKPVGVATA